MSGYTTYCRRRWHSPPVAISIVASKISPHSPKAGILAGGAGGNTSVLVNVHTTVAPAANAMLAEALPTFTVLPFEQVSAVSFQPAGTVSVTL